MAAAGLGVVIVANRLVAGPDVALFHRINHWPGWLYPPMWVVQLSGVIGARRAQRGDLSRSAAVGELAAIAEMVTPDRSAGGRRLARGVLLWVTWM